MTKLFQLINFLIRELPRAIVFFLLTAGAVWLSDWFPKYTGHPEFSPLFTCVYMILILIGFSHVIRRILFHKLDLQKIGKDATTSSIGAGIVFFSICMVLCTIIYCFTTMLR